MKNKWLKCIVITVVVAFLVYNSVYFKKLDAKPATTETNLNPPEYAQKFWAKEFTAYMDSAVEINSFIKMLKADPNGTFQKYSRSQGISNSAYFLVKGEGGITSVNEDNVIVAAKAGTDEITVKLNTDIYFGNAVRDVTGKISMGDFINTMDYNSVSTELNKIVHTQVVLPFKTKAIKAETVYFVACIEITKGVVPVENIQLLPVRVDLNNK